MTEPELGSPSARGDKFFDPSPVSPLLAATSLQPLLEAGASIWTAVVEEAAAADLNEIARPLDMTLPCPIGDYVDFYSSIHHATNVGRIFRPDAEPLTPNWRHLPIGYHGRSGTIVVDGTQIERPSGQRAIGDFGPTRRLDFELEMGFLTGPGPGRIPIAEAENYIFGLLLVNDWSARDIQAWEIPALGPLPGKVVCHHHLALGGSVEPIGGTPN